VVTDPIKELTERANTAIAESGNQKIAENTKDMLESANPVRERDKNAEKVPNDSQKSSMN
jgi:hypothetical protein